MRNTRFSPRGFTLVELTFSLAIGSVLAGLILTYMHIATILTAKNLGTNFSHNSLHKSIDWMTDRIQAAEFIPVLLTTGSSVSLSSGSGSEYSTSGSASASSQSTQVVGVYFDRLVGSPYVFPSTSGTISAGATTATIQYSTNVYASPPAPQANDVLLVNGATKTTGSGTAAVTTTVRPLISSVVISTSGSYQSAALTFSGSFGTTYTWNNTSSGLTEYQTAILIHREAFIVMSNTTTGNNELRYYPNFEGVTTLSSPQYAGNSTAVSYVALSSTNVSDLNNTANYIVLTDQIGTNPSTNTAYPPFSEITTSAGAVLLGVDIRIRGTQYNNVLDTTVSSTSAIQTKEAYEFSQFARIITITPLRQHPTAVFQ